MTELRKLAIILNKGLFRQQYKQLRLATMLIALGFATMFPNSLAFAARNTEGLHVYTTAQQVNKYHKEKLAKDITTLRRADNLWDVLRDEFSLPHYENRPQVQAKIEWYMNNKQFLLRAANRAAPYLYYILQQVRKRHLPAELVLLPIVESGYNPYAKSSAGAAGIWQMMPNTATSLGIRQDWWYDGRRDVIASTRAALNYLAYLQSFFDGNWLLAIAAYNTGEGNVLSAIRKNIRRGKGTDFWQLPVASQTRHYVPSVLALATIISNPDKYPVYLPPVRNAPYLAQLDVRSKINLRYAAKLAGMNYKKLMLLNPGFKRPAAKGPYRLILPIENVEQFSEKLVHSPLHNKNAPGWTHYRVQSGDTLYTIAKRFNTTTTQLRGLNHLAKDRRPKRGTNLLIPIGNNSKTYANKITPKHYISSTPKKRRLASRLKTKLRNRLHPKKPLKLNPGERVYVVKKNDTVSKIARRYHLSINELQVRNKIKSVIKIDQRLIIPKHTAQRSNDSPVKAKANETLYMVRRGDTINKIASKFKASPAAIRLANRVSDANLKAGKKLIIPLPAKA